MALGSRVFCYPHLCFGWEQRSGTKNQRPCPQIWQGCRCPKSAWTWEMRDQKSMCEDGCRYCVSTRLFWVWHDNLYCLWLIRFRYSAHPTQTKQTTDTQNKQSIKPKDLELFTSFMIFDRIMVLALHKSIARILRYVMIFEYNNLGFGCEKIE